MAKIYDKYLELKKDDPDKMYLFKSGKFYIFLADDCDKINDYVVLKKVRYASDIYKCGFPDNVLEDYIRVFNNHHLNYEIIDNYEIHYSNSLDDEILSIDINKITPLEALIKLSYLQERVKNEKGC